jgi:hypothetical protein
MTSSIGDGRARVAALGGRIDRALRVSRQMRVGAVFVSHRNAEQLLGL